MFVEIKNLRFRYNNASQATIDDFHLSMERGEITAILGPSGSGKSTVLRLIAGLEIPEDGSIMIDDRILTDQRHFVQPEKRGIGMVFQDYALFPHMTVADNIKFGLKNWGRLEKQERVEEVLELVNLSVSDYAKRYPYELSGGQQQRIALARALAPNPSVLLLDEPFSNLDSDLHIKIREELRDILKQAGITSIFVTHDQSDAESLADRIVVLKNGKVMEPKPGEPVPVMV